MIERWRRETAYVHLETIGIPTLLGFLDVALQLSLLFFPAVITPKAQATLIYNHHPPPLFDLPRPFANESYTPLHPNLLPASKNLADELRRIPSAPREFSVHLHQFRSIHQPHVAIARVLSVPPDRFDPSQLQKQPIVHPLVLY